MRSGPDNDRIATTTEADDSSYLGRLAARSAATGTVLCLGLDPDPEALPEGFSRDLRGVESFARLVLDVAGPRATAVKPSHFPLSAPDIEVLRAAYERMKQCDTKKALK